MTDPLDTIEAAAQLLAEHGFEVIAEHVRASPQLYAHVAGEDNTRGRSLRREAAYQRRDLALRQAGARWADLLPADAARLLAAELQRYARAWPRERESATNPHPIGATRHWLFQALRAVDRPIGPAQIRRILGAERP